VNREVISNGIIISVVSIVIPVNLMTFETTFLFYSLQERYSCRKLVMGYKDVLIEETMILKEVLSLYIFGKAYT